MADTHNQTPDIVKNGIIAILLCACSFLGWELYYAKQQPPDLRGYSVKIPTYRGKPTDGAFRKMADGRSRVLVEFEDWATGERFAKNQGRFFVKVEKE